MASRLPLRHAAILSSIALIAGLAASNACSAGSDNDGTTSSSSASTGGSGGSGAAGGAGGSTSSGLGGNFSGSGGSGGGGIFSDVEVVITADNAYGFGYGDGTSMFNYFGGVEAMTAGEIFNCGAGPETYVVPAQDAAAGNYLYIVAYADKSTSQGVLGQFRRVEEGAGGGGGAGGAASSGATVYTGTEDWEVCATGQDYSPGSGGPDLNTINAAIPNCTWYDSVGDANGKMQIGEDNTTPRTTVELGNEFPITCGIDDDAKWMWFNWSPSTLDWPSTGSPFIWPGGTANVDQQFLIFRLGAEEVPPLPPQ